MGQAATHGATVADGVVRDVRGRLDQQRVRLPQSDIALDVAPADERPYGERSIRFNRNAVEAGNA